MNAQTIQDNVNKYRYGVLIGNTTEERFGLDAVQRPIQEKFPVSTMKASYGLQNSLLNAQPDQITEKQKEFNNHVKFSNRGVQNHLLIGHGVQQDHFEKKHIGTNYDLTYNQKIPTNTQIWSKYDADNKLSQRTYHKFQLYEKDYQKDMVELGTSAQRTQKPFKPYAEYTKTYDATNFNLPLRK